METPRGVTFDRHGYFLLGFAPCVAILVAHYALYHAGGPAVVTQSVCGLSIMYVFMMAGLSIHVHTDRSLRAGTLVSCIEIVVGIFTVVVAGQWIQRLIFK